MVQSSPWDDVTAVVVTYNSTHVLGPCLEAVAGARRVIVIDNASTDDSCEAARRALAGVEVVRNATNRGLGAAVNQGFAMARTRYGLYLNPDTVPRPDTVARLVAAAEANPGAGLVFPFLVTPEGEVELSVMGPGEHNHRHADVIPEGDFCTWFSTAAAVLVRLEAWRAIDGFDEAFFLYSEDADVCLRITGTGHNLVVVPDARVDHLGGQSSGTGWRVRWLRDWHMTWSHHYLERKHGDAALAISSARRVALRCALKALFYVLVPRPRRVLGNAAKAGAALAFLMGRPSHKPVAGAWVRR